MGITILPISVSINDQSYRDYLDISPGEFIEILRAGGRAFTSQPALGDLLDVLERDDEETIMLALADGLSGEYQTAMGARNSLDYKERVHILNSKSLGGPLRYLVGKAARLRAQGLGAEEIIRELQQSIDNSISFVIPADFSYLRRSGRITQLTSKIGGALRLLPVLTQTEDRRGICLVTIRRSWRAASEVIRTRLKDMKVDRNYLITVAHADAAEQAGRVRGWMQESFPDTETEILELSPSLITHGGPGSVVVQAILK